MVGDLDTTQAAVAELHARILEAWNRQDATTYADQFANDGLVVGFDGSEMHGQDEIAAQLGAIFADHQVASYVRVLRSVRVVRDDVALLHAVVGMVPPGGEDVMPDRHAVQVLLAVRDATGWRAQSFQNTPARYDGRPELVDALTAELRSALRG